MRNTQRLVEELVEVFFTMAADHHLKQNVKTVLAQGQPTRAISAISSAFASYDGRDLYPDEISKAAAMLVNLNRAHPLLTGVKRSTLSVVDYFLRENGYDLQIDADDGLDFLVAVAERRVGYPEARRWILTNTSGRFIRRQVLRIRALVR